MSRLTILALWAAVVLFANGAYADSHDDRFRRILPELRSALMEQDLVKTLRTYNNSRRDMTQAHIDGLEATWQAELNANNQPLVTGVVKNVTALRLRKVIRDTGGVVSEIDLVDARGLSIAQTSVFPRIWQGPTETIVNIAMANPRTVSVGDIESSGPDQPRKFRAYFPVADPDTNEVIGAVIFVVDADALQKTVPDSSY